MSGVVDVYVGLGCDSYLLRLPWCLVCPAQFRTSNRRLEMDVLCYSLNGIPRPLIIIFYLLRILEFHSTSL